MNKGIMVLLTTLVLLGIYLLYTTFAINSYVDNSNTDSYTITLTEDNNTITVPANSDKMIFYQIKNNNDGNVRYGVGYTSNGVDVKVYDDSIDSHMGVLEYGENKFVKLRLSNTTDSDSSVTLSAVLGYEYGGDLIVPNGITLVSEVYTLPVVSSPIPIAEYISNLYTNADKSTFTNNSITYNTASSLLLMNDRLGGTSSSLDGGNIRYYGASPNNYIYFNCEEYPDTNCELWRIIGVFDGKVKIIRNGVIGAYSWDTSSSGVNTGYGVNEWSKADLMKLLNPNYETSSVGGSLYYSEVKTGKCYNNKTNGKVDCDFTSVGIKNNDTINKIADVTYNNGGWNSSSVYSDVMYEKERGTKVKSNASDGITRTTSWDGKIALPYPSDYGYAADFGSCSVVLNSYSQCFDVNWMASILGGDNGGWLITPSSSSAYAAYRIYSLGNMNANTSVYNDYGIAPVVYLKSSVLRISGDGSSGSPYTLS